MFLKRELEGYVCIDHRESPGFSETDTIPLASRGVKFEAPTLTCSHCERVVIINPKRTRERAHCHTCDHFVCDSCGVEMTLLSKPCKTMKQKIDEYLESVIKSPV